MNETKTKEIDAKSERSESNLYIDRKVAKEMEKLYNVFGLTSIETPNGHKVVKKQKSFKMS